MGLIESCDNLLLPRPRYPSPAEANFAQPGKGNERAPLHDPRLTRSKPAPRKQQKACEPILYTSPQSPEPQVKQEPFRTRGARLSAPAIAKMGMESIAFLSIVCMAILMYCSRGLVRGEPRLIPHNALRHHGITYSSSAAIPIEFPLLQAYKTRSKPGNSTKASCRTVRKAVYRQSAG